MSAVSLFSPVTPEFIQAFAKGDLVLDCGKVELTQLREESPRRHLGRGLLLLREGEFHFRIYADPAANQHLTALDELREMGTWTAGEIIPKEEYYQLKATDLSGREWSCAQVQVKLHGGQHGLVITGRMFGELVHSAKVEDTGGGGLSLYFFDPMPLALDRYATTRTELVGELVRSGVDAVEARFNAGGLDFRVQKRPQDPFTVVRAFSTQPLAAGAELRVEEAMRFVTMRPARWSIAENVSAGERRVTLTPHREPNKPFLEEPVEPRSDLAQDYWRLFGLFFEFVSTHATPKEYHPLTVQIYHLTEGEAQQLDLVGLALAVAVEGALKVAFPNVAEPSAAFKAAVDQIHKDIGKLTSAEATLVKRVQGPLGGLKSARPGDKLRALVQKGVVTQEQSETWTRLRNSSAHANVRVDPEAANKRWRECLLVYTMLHRLIFHAIGYQGHYCDYGSFGWPTVPFTLNPLGEEEPKPSAG